MDIELLDFLSDVDQSHTEDDVWQAWLKACDGLGFGIINYTFAQDMADGSTSVSYHTNYDADFKDYYLSQSYQNHDYMVDHILGKSMLPLIHDIDRPGDELLNTKEKSEIWMGAAECGMKRGVCFNFSDIGGSGAGGVGIGTDQMSSTDFSRVLETKGSTLYAIAQVAHQHLKHMYMSLAAPSTISFSPRQREILQFLTQGLTNKDISCRLNISTTTVSFHLKAIAKKLEVNNSREILPRALSLKLVEF